MVVVAVVAAGRYNLRQTPWPTALCHHLRCDDRFIDQTNERTNIQAKIEKVEIDYLRSYDLQKCVAAALVAKSNSSTSTSTSSICPQ